MEVRLYSIPEGQKGIVHVVFGAFDFPCVNPLSRSSWTGRLVSLDGTSNADFTETDVLQILAAGEDDDRWDGNCACVFRLKDGRYVSYETFWGPTGDGFAADAYGGDADLNFAANLETVVRFGLTDEGRKLCGLENFLDMT